MYSLYMKVRPGLLVFCTLFATVLSYMLVQWAKENMSDFAGGLLADSLAGLLTIAWVLTTDQISKWRAGRPLRPF